MKTKRFFLLLPLLAALTLTACGGDDDSTTPDGTTTETKNNTNKNVATAGMPSEITHMEFPKVKGGNSTVIVHTTSGYGVNFCTEYDLSKKSQRWSCYAVYKQNNVKNWTRSKWEGATWSGKVWQGDPFQPDPAVDASLQAGIREYNADPMHYQRGHIVASEDRIMSMDANGQTFYMTNMQPQIGGFNSGVWLNMESQVRKYCPTNDTDTLWVAKGGTIDNADQILGYTTNGFIVPKYFWMALLLKNSSGYKAMGFWVEHKSNSDTNLSSYIVNIDELERLTGIDFFCNLPDNVENHVESLSVESVKRAWGFK